MVLQDLRISIVPSYKANAGQYEGKANFSGEAGEVTLKLTPSMCDRIFQICADGIMETAKEAAQNLVANVIEHKQFIESQES